MEALQIEIKKNIFTVRSVGAACNKTPAACRIKCGKITKLYVYILSHMMDAFLHLCIISSYTTCTKYIH